MVKNILARIWAVWGIVIFTSTLLIIFIFFCFCFLFKEPKRSKITHALYKGWMNVFFILILVRKKITGKKVFQKNKNYVVISNHRSLLDVPLTTPFMPAANKTIAKSSMAKIPLFGIIYKLGSVLVDRNDKNSRQKSFTEMNRVLKMGLNMCLYPEGTRNKTSTPLLPFYDGAFKLAIDAKKNIIPSVILGTDQVLPANKTFYLFPGKVSLHYLPEINSANKTVDDLKNECYTAIENYYTAHTKHTNTKS